jgi:hypothetical protein
MTSDDLGQILDVYEDAAAAWGRTHEPADEQRMEAARARIVDAFRRTATPTNTPKTDGSDIYDCTRCGQDVRWSADPTHWTGWVHVANGAPECGSGFGGGLATTEPRH